MLNLRRHRRLLRTALLVLLALGMVVQPALGALGELHEVEHAAIAQSDSGHDHGDDHLHDHDADTGHQHGDGSDQDHATGPHGLLHQAASASATLPDPVTFLPPQVPAGSHLPESGPLHLPGDAPGLPFRPPIA